MQVRFLSAEDSSILWQLNDITISLTSRISKERGKQRLLGYIDQLKSDFESSNSLVDLMREIGPTNIVRLAQMFCPALFKRYLLTKASAFTNRRKKITITAFLKDIFGRNDNLFDRNDALEISGFLNNIVRDEYVYQCTYFIETNQKAMDLSQSSWILYWVDGAALCCRDFNFSKIKYPTIRKEVMGYFKNLLNSKTRFRNDYGIALITRAINYLTSYNPSIKHFADIGATDIASLLNYLSTDAKTQHGKRLSPGTISDSFGDCGQVVSFLMDSNNDIPKGFPRPQHNYFKDVGFKNQSKMEKKTRPIPNCVIDQIYLHLNELIPIHQTVFRVFDGTGLRADEVVSLDENCLKYNEEKKFWLLRHIPQKVIEARRRNRLPDHHEIGITQNEVDLIQSQIKETKELRQKMGMKYIFLHEITSGHTTSPVKVVQSYAFNNAINRLIKEHNIVDEGGNLWHFKSRQFRKKVAVNMIENGATPREVGHHFGHMEERTSIQYYAEVAETKLADLNAQFFKEKFEMELGPAQLALYNEEERRALYVDFCLSRREVELGACVRHISLGSCGKKSGKTNCATCGNICTGKQYLHKWIALRESQQKIVDELTALYRRERITGYEYFKEYQRELYLLQSYEATIAKIVCYDAFSKNRKVANLDTRTIR